jgi:hypothetical protein
MRRSNLGPLVLLLGAAASTSACADAAPAADAPPEAARAVSVLDGPCGEVHGASVCSWAEVEGERVVGFGLDIPLASITDADHEAPFVWPPALAATVAMPDVVRERFGVMDVTIFWEAHGHPPAPYLIPHFDYHFYVIRPSERAAIDCADLTKPDALPAGYALPDVDIPEVGRLVGLCVPAMGMHSLLESEMESEEPFDGTMVIGYYAGDPIFFEPMIPQDRFLDLESFSLDMPAVAGMGSGVVLPTRFEAVYDESTSAYRFVFSGFSTS